MAYKSSTPPANAVILRSDYLFSPSKNRGLELWSRIGILKSTGVFLLTAMGQGILTLLVCLGVEIKLVLLYFTMLLIGTELVGSC